jgi:ppGpp synthetase/RelA/SpoT-type nucleotidyltranferase
VVRVPKKTQAFLDRYTASHDVFKAAAAELQGYIASSINDLPIPIHITIARPKPPASLRSKCRRKKYKNPALQITDILAVRVITYFKDDVDGVSERLRNVLDVSETKSRDTRKELAENQFGYRSMHLVARLRRTEASARSALGRQWFEVQIRSILDHAWSEIEHEIIYKSGIRYPESVRRRFKALAASLEVLEDAFAALKTERNSLLKKYTAEYAANLGMDQRFDVARMQAFLQLKRPNGVSWAAAEHAGTPFPHGSAAAAVEALHAASLDTARKLSAVMQNKRFRGAIVKFASIESIAPETASHLAVVVVAIAVSNPRLLQQEFPEIVFSPAVTAVVKSLS